MCVEAAQLVLKGEVLLGAAEERQAWVRWWYRRLAAGGGSRVATSAVDARRTACAIVPLKPKELTPHADRGPERACCARMGGPAPRSWTIEVSSGLSTRRAAFPVELTRERNSSTTLVRPARPAAASVCPILDLRPDTT